MSNGLFMSALWANGIALGFAVASGMLVGAWAGLLIVLAGSLLLIPGVMKRLSKDCP